MISLYRVECVRRTKPSQEVLVLEKWREQGVVDRERFVWLPPTLHPSEVAPPNEGDEVPSPHAHSHAGGGEEIIVK